MTETNSRISYCHHSGQYTYKIKLLHIQLLGRSMITTCVQIKYQLLSRKKKSFYSKLLVTEILVVQSKCNSTCYTLLSYRMLNIPVTTPLVKQFLFTEIFPFFLFIQVHNVSVQFHSVYVNHIRMYMRYNTYKLFSKMFKTLFE